MFYCINKSYLRLPVFSSQIVSKRLKNRLEIPKITKDLVEWSNLNDLLWQKLSIGSAKSVKLDLFWTPFSKELESISWSLISSTVWCTIEIMLIGHAPLHSMTIETVKCTVMSLSGFVIEQASLSLHRHQLISFDESISFTNKRDSRETSKYLNLNVVIPWFPTEIDAND